MFIIESYKNASKKQILWTLLLMTIRVYRIDSRAFFVRISMIYLFFLALLNFLHDTIICRWLCCNHAWIWRWSTSLGSEVVYSRSLSVLYNTSWCIQLLLIGGPTIYNKFWWGVLWENINPKNSHNNHKHLSVDYNHHRQ